MEGTTHYHRHVNDPDTANAVTTCGIKITRRLRDGDVDRGFDLDKLVRCHGGKSITVTKQPDGTFPSVAAELTALGWELLGSTWRCPLQHR